VVTTAVCVHDEGQGCATTYITSPTGACPNIRDIIQKRLSFTKMTMKLSWHWRPINPSFWMKYFIKWSVFSIVFYENIWDIVSLQKLSFCNKQLIVHVPGCTRVLLRAGTVNASMGL
jgi:hypothetical protein